MPNSGSGAVGADGLTDKEWLKKRMAMFRGAELEQFMERIAICMEAGESEHDARLVALDDLKRVRRNRLAEGFINER